MINKGLEYGFQNHIKLVKQTQIIKAWTIKSKDVIIFLLVYFGIYAVHAETKTI